MDPPYAKCSNDPTGLSTRAPQAFCEYHPRILWIQIFPAIGAFPEVSIPRILGMKLLHTRMLLCPVKVLSIYQFVLEKPSLQTRDYHFFSAL